MPCDGVKFPHLGESTAGLHWAVDRAAHQLASLNDELLIHGMRGMIRDASEVLLAHGVAPPPSPMVLDPARDPSWDARQAQILVEIKRNQAKLDKLQASLLEWEGPVVPARPIIHRRWTWRDRPGTAVPRCWSQALRRPTADFILTDELADVTCRDICSEKFQANDQSFRGTTK